MKRTISLIILIMAAVLLGGEEIPVKENPAVPTGSNAGRIVALNEVLRVTGDDDGDFYLKRPGKIKVAPDGGFFLVDGSQFLRFDTTGKYINNQQKKGEGPGEYVYMNDYHFSGTSIFIFAQRPSKIIITDLTGKLIKEQRLTRQMGFHRILGVQRDGYWAAGAEFGEFGKLKTGYFDVKRELMKGTFDGKTRAIGLMFKEKTYLMRQKMGDSFQIWILNAIPAFFATDKHRQLYVSNSREYKIQQVDLEKGKITGAFNRKYTRIPFQKENTEEAKKYDSAPAPDFFNDIRGIFINNDHIWVLTSTITKGKGLLVDVFSKEGVYTDNFYLPLPQVETPHDINRSNNFNKPITLYKNFLFTVETDDDDNPVVVKYKMDL
ncbi:MAG: 6-bladed beta-propeller [bacterium]|nr:6-bladed beta-propeller [bacterium]